VENSPAQEDAPAERGGRTNRERKTLQFRVKDSPAQKDAPAERGGRNNRERKTL
jgi:hypothetical protein